MCIACWKMYGSPRIVNSKFEVAVALIKAVFTEDPQFNLIGDMHIILEDWNLEDAYLESAWARRDDLTLHGLLCVGFLRLCTLEERASALGYFEQFWGHYDK